MGWLVDIHFSVGQILGRMNALLFFDLDHTLWDFETNSRLALTQGYDAFDLGAKGIPRVEDWIEAYEEANDLCWAEYRAGRMTKDVLRGQRFLMASEKLGAAMNEDLAQRLGQHYILTSPHQTGLIQGTHALLSELQKRGHDMWLLTNGFEEVQHLKVDRCGLSTYFHGVLTSDALGVKKPHPDAFLKALESTGVVNPGQIYMIGDSWESDIEGAQNVGWRGVHFNPSGSVEPGAWKTVRRLEEVLALPLIP